MKKRFILSALLVSLFIMPVCAVEHGPTFGAGFVGMIKPYAYESVAYRIQSEKLGVDVGVRVLENIIYNPAEPFVSIEPCVNIFFGNFYIGGGLFIAPPMSEIAGFFRTGYILGDWDWGPGKGGLDIGLELSPTVYVVDSDDDNVASEIIGTIFLSIFNICKFNIGVTYYIPL